MCLLLTGAKRLADLIDNLSESAGPERRSFVSLYMQVRFILFILLCCPSFYFVNKIVSLYMQVRTTFLIW